MIVALLSEYPEEIEADLLFRGVDVFDWYQGRMSSRRLLACIRNLPAKSAFKAAYSEHDWPLEAHIATGTWNEIKALRGDIWAFLGHETLSFKPVLPPSAEREQKQKRAAMRVAHDELMAQLRGDGGAS